MIGTNLQALLDHTASSESSSSIVLVISNIAGVKGLERAKKAGVDIAVCQSVLIVVRSQWSSGTTLDCSTAVC